MWLLALIACQGAYDGPAPSGDGAAVYGRVVGILGSGLADVQVCADDLDLDCVFSEKDGDFLLEGLPEDSDVLIRMSKDDHMDTLYHHNTGLDQEWRKTLMSDFIMNSMVNKADLELNPDKGHAMFILWSGPDYEQFDRVAGVQFTSSMPGKTFYQASGGLPDLDLNETSKSGSGGVFNVSPGPIALHFSGGGVTCRPWFSHDFAPGDPVPMTTKPGLASYIDLVCD